MYGKDPFRDRLMGADRGFTSPAPAQGAMQPRYMNPAFRPGMGGGQPVQSVMPPTVGPKAPPMNDRRMAQAMLGQGRPQVAPPAAPQRPVGFSGRPGRDYMKA